MYASHISDKFQFLTVDGIVKIRTCIQLGIIIQIGLIVPVLYIHMYMCSHCREHVSHSNWWKYNPLC